MDGRKGRFIVFEGIDGSGKSTQVRRLKAYLCSKGIKCEETREPQDERPVGALLRKALKGEISLDEGTIALLFAADRLDHIRQMKSKLESGISIICDRYFFSSFAYNDTSLDGEWVFEINAEAMRNLMPDMVIFLDLPSEVSLARVAARGKKELYENVERQERVRKNYFSVFKRFEDKLNITVIDGAEDSAEVAKKVHKAVDNLF